jgi:ABC-type multidrug transport system fused ATPase/permease subunit
MALLGEVPYHEGNRIVNSGKMAYVESEPFIFPATIRENILFERAYDKDLYHQITELCCLDVDIKEMPKGDDTEIGERG